MSEAASVTSPAYLALPTNRANTVITKQNTIKSQVEEEKKRRSIMPGSVLIKLPVHTNRSSKSEDSNNSRRNLQKSQHVYQDAYKSNTV